MMNVTGYSMGKMCCVSLPLALAWPPTFSTSSPTLTRSLYSTIWSEDKALCRLSFLFSNFFRVLLTNKNCIYSWCTCSDFICVYIVKWLRKDDSVPQNMNSTCHRLLMHLEANRTPGLLHELAFSPASHLNHNHWSLNRTVYTCPVDNILLRFPGLCLFET
jgi:hypothetical protein